MTHEPPAAPPRTWITPSPAPASAGPAANEMWRTLGYWLRELAVLCGHPAELAVRILSRSRRARIRAMLLQVERIARILVLEAAIRLAATLTLPAPRASASTDKAQTHKAQTDKAQAAPPAGAGSPTDPSGWTIGFSWTAPDIDTPRPRPKPRGPAPRIIVLDDPLPSIFRRKPVPLPPPPSPPPPPPVFRGRFGAAAPMNWPLTMQPQPAFNAAWAGAPPGGVSGDLPAPQPDLRLAARFELLRRMAAAPQPLIERLARRYARAAAAERYALAYQPCLLWKAKSHVQLDADDARGVLIAAAAAHPDGLPRAPGSGPANKGRQPEPG
jgi:hypothetical protein